MGWRNLKPWIKGGVVGAIFYLTSLLIYLTTQQLGLEQVFGSRFEDYVISFLSPIWIGHFLLGSLLPNWIMIVLSIIMWYGVGSLIGWVIYWVRRRTIHR